MATKTTKPAADLVYLCRALKAPSLAQSIERLAERARSEGWSHEEFLAACLEREVAARQANGGEIRVRAARFPARKTIEEFDFDHQRSLRREVVAHLGTLDFIAAKDLSLIHIYPNCNSILQTLRRCRRASWRIYQ